MATDLRIATDLVAHPKILRMIRRLGERSLRSLLALWGWVATNRPDGDLSGLSDEEIAIVAGWPEDQDPATYVRALVDLRLLDGDPGSYRVHDWAEHQPWIVGRGARRERALALNRARWGMRRTSVPESVPESVPHPARNPCRIRRGIRGASVTDSSQPNPDLLPPCIPPYEGGDVQRPASRPAAPALALDRQQWRIQGITDERRQRWLRAYPGIDLDAEIARAEEWCRANPDRAPRKRIDRLLASWFSRATDALRPKRVATRIPNHEPQPQRPQGPITEGSLDWPRVSGVLAVRCDAWRDWESRVTYLGDRDGRAVLMAPDDFAARWLRDNLQSIIEEAIYDVAGQHRPVEVLGGEP